MWKFRALLIFSTGHSQLKYVESDVFGAIISYRAVCALRKLKVCACAQDTNIASEGPRPINIWVVMIIIATMDLVSVKKQTNAYYIMLVFYMWTRI